MLMWMSRSSPASCTSRQARSSTIESKSAPSPAASATATKVSGRWRSRRASSTAPAPPPPPAPRAVIGRCAGRPAGSRAAGAVRAAQRGREVHMHPRGRPVNHRGVLAEPLAGVHRHVGLTQQIVGGLRDTVLSRPYHTHAGPYPHRGTVHRERLAQRDPQPLGPASGPRANRRSGSRTRHRRCAPACRFSPSDRPSRSPTARSSASPAACPYGR